MTASPTAVIGASTLLGRELVERAREAGVGLGETKLVDPGSGVGVIAAVAGTLQVATPHLAEALEDAGLALICVPLEAEDRALVVEAARRIPVLDLCGTLEGAPIDATAAPAGALAPGVHASPSASSLVVAALDRSARAAGARELIAVVLEPASEMGQGALDEMYEQAVALLNFRPLPTAVFGQQAVHDVASPGPGGAQREARLRREVAGLLGRDAPPLLAAQAGTFHGLAVAAHADVAAGRWREAMAGEPRLSPAGTAHEATPVRSVAAQTAVVGRVDDDGRGGAWAWVAADTLAHGAVGNAIALLARAGGPRR